MILFSRHYSSPLSWCWMTYTDMLPDHVRLTNTQSLIGSDKFGAPPWRTSGFRLQSPFSTEQPALKSYPLSSQVSIRLLILNLNITSTYLPTQFICADHVRFKIGSKTRLATSMQSLSSAPILHLQAPRRRLPFLHSSSSHFYTPEKRRRPRNFNNTTRSST